MSDNNQHVPKIPRSMQLAKEATTSRRSIINELNFTYERLLRLLPGIIKHVDADPVGQVLAEQDRMDRKILDRLDQVATEQGEPPGPCVCDDASMLVEAVHHADRAANTPAERASNTVSALTSVRTFLIRAWGRLIGTLSTEVQPEYLQEARKLQQREAELHRELVAVSQRIDDATERPEP